MNQHMNEMYQTKFLKKTPTLVAMTYIIVFVLIKYNHHFWGFEMRLLGTLTIIFEVLRWHC
jgi:hypothetical protein